MWESGNRGTGLVIEGTEAEEVTEDGMGVTAENAKGAEQVGSGGFGALCSLRSLRLTRRGSGSRTGRSGGGRRKAEDRTNLELKKSGNYPRRTESLTTDAHSPVRENLRPMTDAAVWPDWSQRAWRRRSARRNRRSEERAIERMVAVAEPMRAATFGELTAGNAWSAEERR